MSSYRVEEYQTREEWLEKRGMIGGSDCSTILGINRWKTPLELWAEKTGRTSDHGPPSLPMRVGSIIEPLTLALLEEQTGIKCWRPKVRTVPKLQLRSEERPWQTFTPDALYYSSGKPRWSRVEGPVEVKYVQQHNADTWAERHCSGAMGAEAQLHHGMAVGGWDGGYIAGLIGSKEIRWFEVARDPDIEDALLTQERMFIQHVEKDIPPEAEFTARTERALKHILPFATRHEVVLDNQAEIEEAVDMLHHQAEAKAHYKAFDNLRASLKARALVEAGIGTMRRSEGLKITVPSVGVWSWKLVDVKGYEVAAKTREDWRLTNG